MATINETIVEAFLKWYDRPVPKMDNQDWDYYFHERIAWIAAIQWFRKETIKRLEEAGNE